MTRTVVGVLGGSGGVGASSFAAVLGAVLADVVGRALLVDADPAGGGADVLLGVEGEPGVRWSGLRLGGGRLDTDLLLSRLPVWRSVSVLACDRGAPTPSAARQLIDAAAERVPVVVDLARPPAPLRDAVLPACTVALVVAEAGVVPASAAAAVVRSLPADLPVGVLLREGELDEAEVAVLVPAPIVGLLPAREPREAVAERLPGAAVDAAKGVADALWSGLESAEAASAPVAERRLVSLA